jgi:hypothetical protein
MTTKQRDIGADVQRRAVRGKVAKYVGVILLLCAAASCKPAAPAAPAAPTAPAGQDPATVVHSDVVGPASAALPDFPSVVSISNGTKTCSGIIIGWQWVLTSGQCFDRNKVSNLNVTVSGSGVATVTVPVSKVIPNLLQDTEILVTTYQLKAEPVRVFTGTMDSSWVGRQVFTVGFGNANNDASARRGGFTTIAGVSGSTFTLGSSGSSWLCGADLGGPSLVNMRGRWYVVGTHSGVAAEPGCAFATSTDTRVDTAGIWIRSIVQERGDGSSIPSSSSDPAGAWGDVNTDGFQDLIVSTAAGGNVYFGGGPSAGLRKGPAWAGAFGFGEAVLGDFDQPGPFSHFPDMVTMDWSGVYWRMGQGNFISDPIAVTNNLLLGYTNLQVGDFNGDQKADLLVVNVYGTSIYRYNSTANTLVDAWDLPTKRIYDTKATVADFDGDGLADVMFQDDSGAQLWTGSTDGTLHDSGFRNAAWTRSNAALSPGRFMSTTGRDLIVVGPPGTGMELYQVSQNPIAFTRRWSNTGLIIGFDSVTVGNFGGATASNGAPLDDILITDGWGTFLYLSTGNPSSPWNANVWVRYDLTLRNTEIAVADWSGDGLSDLVIITPSGAAGYMATGGVPSNTWNDPTMTFQRVVFQ